LNNLFADDLILKLKIKTAETLYRLETKTNKNKKTN